MGPWGAHLTVFANATKLRLEGSRQADFTMFIRTSGNWGVSFNRERVTLSARWNYRGLDKRTPQPAFGPDGYQYIVARTYLDLNAAYQLTRHLSLATSVSNALNVPQETLTYGSSTPGYARQFGTREYGIAIALALKGTY